MSLPKNEDQNKTDLHFPAKSSADATRVAVLTGTGRSAVAVIEIRGNQAAALLARCFCPATDRPLRPGEIRFGDWNGSGDADPEAVVVTPLRSDAYEVHCHGGTAAITRIVNDLRGIGAVVTSRAGPHEPLIIEEARQVLARCVTTRTAAIALDQVRGAMRDWAQQWHTRINHAASSELATIQVEIQQWLGFASFAGRLAEPFRVVLYGPPNVGKSSLVNAIVGFDRSITYDAPGTTRDVLHWETVIDGLPVQLSDTAGIRESDKPVEQSGVQRANQAVKQADLVVCVHQPGIQCPLPVPDALSVLNKADLLNADGNGGLSGAEPVPHEAIRTVATSGAGVEELMRVIAQRLVQVFPSPGTPVPLNQRQLACLEEIAASNEPSAIQALLAKLVWGEAG